MIQKESKEILVESLEQIDDEFLQEAVVTDNKSAFKSLLSPQEKEKKILTFILKAAAVWIGVIIAAVSVLVGQKLNKANQISGDKIILNNGEITSSSNETYITEDEGGGNVSGDAVTDNESNADSTVTPEKDQSEVQSSKPQDTQGNKPNKPKDESNVDNNDEKAAIDSFDKLNYYVVKKIISDNSVLPTADFTGNNYISPDRDYSEYEINKDATFEITMAAYFQIELKNPNGFLAKTLGGTGKVEVAITKNSFCNLITFKKGDKFYSCLENSSSYDDGEEQLSFTTSKYIEGFNLVKNFNQENFKFNVTLVNSKVTDIVAVRFYEEPTDELKYEVDEIKLEEDFCVVIFQRRTFTVAELEQYINNVISGKKEFKL